MPTLHIIQFSLIYHKKRQKHRTTHSEANECGEEAQKETTGLINIGLPQSMKVYVYNEKDGAYTELCNHV